MPYRDQEAQRESDREKAKRYRAKQKGVTDGVTQAQGVTELVEAEGVTGGDGVTEPWQHVRDFISRQSPGKMSNLEKLQRIAGSLGKLSGEVWFDGLTMEDIGEVIGVKPALV